MPKALIIGIDLTLSATVTNILAHERKVASNFASNAPEGWTSEILMHTNNSDVADESDVVAIVNSGTNDCEIPFGSNNTQSNIMCWVSQNIDDYDLVIMSYDVDGYYGFMLSEIINAYDTPLFMPMSNTDSTNATYKKSNIVYVGGGVSSNERGKGQKIECYDDTKTGGTTTSFTVPTVAGKFAHLLSTLTVNQALKALRYSCDLDDWTSANGFGKVPDSIPTPNEYLLEPPQGLLVFIDLGGNVRINYTEFYGDSPDSIRIYVDDELFYDGNGTEVVRYGWGGYGEAYKLLSARYKRLAFPASDFTEGDREFKIVAVKDGTESRAESFNITTVTIPESEEEPDPTPEPEPDVGDEEPVEEEEDEQDVILPDPTKPTAIRTGNEITLTRNETTATVKVYRKLRENDEWELVGETTEESFTDEIDPTKNYIYAIRLSNSETESALSESVFVAGYKETSTVSQAIF